MARAFGTKNKLKPGMEGYQKPGTKPGQSLIAKRFYMSPEEILDAKVEILALLTDGVAKTISSAAKILNLKPTRVYGWAKQDKDFAQWLTACHEVIADELEEGFLTGRNDIPKMMILKGYRPVFRDNFKIEYNTEAVEKFLKELKELGDKAKEENKE